MKQGIHPKFKLIKFTDISSGTVFEIASTLSEDMSVEISSATHPFYTGEARVIDTENRIESFNNKAGQAQKLLTKVSDKKKKMAERKKSKVNKIQGKEALTLRDMLQNIK